MKEVNGWDVVERKEDCDKWSKDRDLYLAYPESYPALVCEDRDGHVFYTIEAVESMTEALNRQPRRQNKENNDEFGSKEYRC